MSTDDEWPEGARLVCTLPEDAQHKNNADWRREERSHGLYVVKELRAALHHRNPRDAHTHHHQYEQPAQENGRVVSPAMGFYYLDDKG